MIKDIQNDILKLKREKDVCILAHSYVAQEIKEIADFTGDSYALAVKSKSVSQKTVIMCGVRFMAETVKILAPEKKVILSNPIAGCPMAEQMDRETILQVKEKYPDYGVVAYINTTADLKTVCDVCVTSSSAVEICKKVDFDKILFIPDCNLGSYVAKKVPEKEFKLLNGGCPTHAKISEKKLLEAMNEYPNAKVLLHPECQADLVKHADYVGSTSGIMNYAKESSDKEFIIGTEISIAEELQYTCPDKKFYPMSKDLICSNMKSTTLMDVYNCLLGDFGEEITMSEEKRLAAKKCIDEMIRLG